MPRSSVQRAAASVACGVLTLVLQGRAAAQTATPAAPEASLAFEAIPVVDAAPSASSASGRFWLSSEYVHWWTRSAPVPVPLVTTGDPVNDAFPGAIGQPGTRVLFGGNDVDFGGASGMRLTLGAWLDNERTLGFEATGFALEQQSSRFSIASDSVGNPPIYLPAFNTAAGGERSLRVSDPVNQFAGGVSIDSSLELWGTEFNGVFTVVRRPGMEFSLLAGFRYMDLRENLHLNNPTTDLFFGSFEVIDDSFATQNQFYGGQLGGRLSLQVRRFTLDVTGKVALGSTHQIVDVNGSSTLTALPGGIVPTPSGPGTFPGGFFAEPSNIGRRSADTFGVIPAVELKLGYQLTERLRIFAGYDFLYWNSVVRPGNQIDRNINPTQVPVLGLGPATGSAQPAPLFSRSDFWVQGVSFGMELKF